jgi:glycosyltransferase involved in cell wall biosynthesis
MGRFFSRINAVICITEKLAKYTAETYGVEYDRLFVAPDGVNMSPYKDFTQSHARDLLGLPSEQDIVLYTGHCYPGKGVETLIRAAEHINALVYIAGGYETDIERIRTVTELPDNVRLTGFIEPSQIPQYQVAADILVAPYDDRSRDYLSPLKLFEYMAAGKPIVASDKPVLREVLTDGENALLFKTGDPDDLARQIQALLTDDSLRSSLAETSGSQITEYTWKSRAADILDFLG